MQTLTIGKVAREAGIGVETVRFYEREGLLEAPPRSQSGYRHFPESAVRRLQFIRRAKELGFTLREIRELLSLRLDPSTTCSEVKQQAESKIADIQKKIRVLLRMEQSLLQLTKSCRGNGAADECPILDSLETKAESHAEC